MAKLIINSYEEFASHLGEKLGESDWLQVDQERINLYADATLDHQWIHVDVERAKEESPYHSTIAHGYLTLSLLPYLWQQIVEVRNIKMLVNYGIGLVIIFAILIAVPFLVRGIAALVAAFIYLWNTNEEFRQFWIDLWESIKEIAIAVWEVLKEFFTAAWEAIKSTAEAVWNGIKDFFTGL